MPSCVRGLEVFVRGRLGWKGGGMRAALSPLPFPSASLLMPQILCFQSVKGSGFHLDSDSGLLDDTGPVSAS